MSKARSRHAAPDATTDADDDATQHGPTRVVNTKAFGKVRFWAVPIGVTLAVLAAVGYFYLGGILNPMTNLKHFPIAVVNEDAGPAGEQVVKDLLANFENDDAYEVRVLGRDDYERELNTAQIYGVAVIPPTFSSTLVAYAKKLQDFAKGEVDPGHLERTGIRVVANPRAGTLGATIAEQALTRAANMVDRRFGEQLSREVLQQAGNKALPSAVRFMLANPIEVAPIVYHPLPDGDRTGLSPFYYSLLLLLAGFTGSFVVSMVVDSMLGFVPAEFGPVYRLAEQVKISRFRTLLIKWAFMVVLALLTSGIYLFIAAKLGMPIQHSVLLWLYGVFAILAVGITSTSLIAVLGAVGLLVSMFVFVILGLPSAGATVPLQAAPQLFGWLANFDPMHQVFLGARALLYLNGQADAGLSHALTMITVWLVFGLLFGGVLTYLYDRRGYHQTAPALVAATPLTDPVE
jgi:uncharacterized phage infection (PIP) family protein YhgE